MDNNTFWTKFFEATAWPFATVLMVALFSDDIKGILNKIQSVIKLKGLGLEAEFERETKDALQAVEAIKPQELPTPAQVVAAEAQAAIRENTERAHETATAAGALNEETQVAGPNELDRPPLSVREPTLPYGDTTVQGNEEVRTTEQPETLQQNGRPPERIPGMHTFTLADHQYGPVTFSGTSPTDLANKVQQWRSAKSQFNEALMRAYERPHKEDTRTSALIFEAWRDIEVAVSALCQAAGMETLSDSAITKLDLLNSQFPALYPGDETRDNIWNLLEMRNKVASLPDFEPTPKAATNYQRAARKVIEQLMYAEYAYAASKWPQTHAGFRKAPE